MSKPLSTATKLYPTPDASVEMGLTQVAAMVAKDDFEDSTPSVTPSASLKTTFLNNVSVLFVVNVFLTNQSSRRHWGERLSLSIIP